VAIVSLAQLRVKIVEQVLFPTSSLVSIECQVVKGRVSIPPKLYPLDSAQTPDVPIRVCPAVRVAPDHVNVEPVNQVSCPDVTLQLDGPIDGGELVLDFDVLIMHHAACGAVPYAVWFKKGEI
jgi:hypothetical protein